MASDILDWLKERAVFDWFDLQCYRLDRTGDVARFVKELNAHTWQDFARAMDAFAVEHPSESDRLLRFVEEMWDALDEFYAGAKDQES